MTPSPSPKTPNTGWKTPAKTPLIIIEIQTGDKLLENDIIRFEDIYNRK